MNHLLFTDDTMFFCNSTPDCCNNLVKILSEYERASGQKINRDKSAITFSSKNVRRNEKKTAKSILNIRKERGLGKYLSLHEHFGRRKKDIFTSVVDRIGQRAASWTTRFLSKAGKLTMLKSALTAIPNHTMSCFLLPVSLCKIMQSTLTRFWWDGPDGKGKMCCVSWDTLTKPKAKGGLGLRDIQLFNQALLAKLAWRILTVPNCLLSRILLGKYCHNKSFLEVYVPAVCSHGWHSILHGLELLKSCMRKAIGNGLTTKVWQDSWILLEKNLKPIGPCTESVLDLWVSDLLTSDLKWNKQMLEEMLPALAAQIQTIRPSTKGA